MSIINFLQSTRAELKHVTWPSRKQAILLTIVVILVSIIVGYLLGAFDLLFKVILKTILSL